MNSVTIVLAAAVIFLAGMAYVAAEPVEPVRCGPEGQAYFGPFADQKPCWVLKSNADATAHGAEGDE